jgi:F-type H+-transporting ATPase subunit epsilon
VKEIVAQTTRGSYGILPHRLDCAGSLTPGILTYTTGSGQTIDLAVDQGVLIKVGDEVLISVRDAIGGMALGDLHQAVQRQFVDLTEQEKSLRSSLEAMEAGFIHKFIGFQHD